MAGSFGYWRHSLPTQFSYLVTSLPQTASPIGDDNWTFFSVTGHHIKTVGKTSVNMLGKDIAFFVVKNLNFDFLLGSDALRVLNSAISYVNNEVTLNDTKHKLSSFDSFDHCTFAVYSELDWWMCEFPDVFAGEGQSAGKTDVTMLEIDTGDHPSIRQRAYRIPLTKRLVVEHELDKMLAEEVMEPSSSPWASPITLVTKKDGGTRFCVVDFRKINAITRKDTHPLPNIQDIFDSMAGSSVFSTLDFKSGYWQIGVHPNSIEKTAFITHKGLFQFKRMPFGLCNASAVFQRTMNKILAPYVGNFVLVYIDDVVIYSKSQEEHDEHLRKVFQTLQDAGLKVKPSKCSLRAPEINLFIIDRHGKRSYAEKTKAICNMDRPKSVSEIRSFWGMTGYHRQHIPNYAEIAFPLTQLTKKNAQYQWGAPETEAWECLKSELVSDRVRAHPQLDKPYKVYTKFLLLPSGPSSFRKMKMAWNIVFSMCLNNWMRLKWNMPQSNVRHMPLCMAYKNWDPICTEQSSPFTLTKNHSWVCFCRNSATLELKGGLCC